MAKRTYYFDAPPHHVLELVDDGERRTFHGGATVTVDDTVAVTVANLVRLGDAEPPIEVPPDDPQDALSEHSLSDGGAALGAYATGGFVSASGETPTPIVAAGEDLLPDVEQDGVDTTHNDSGQVL